MKKRKSISYSKWGYIFILPFFVSFFIFSFISVGKISLNKEHDNSAGTEYR